MQFAPSLFQKRRKKYKKEGVRTATQENVLPRGCSVTGSRRAWYKPGDLSPALRKSKASQRPASTQATRSQGWTWPWWICLPHALMLSIPFTVAYFEEFVWPELNEPLCLGFLCLPNPIQHISGHSLRKQPENYEGPRAIFQGTPHSSADPSEERESPGSAGAGIYVSVDCQSGWS